MRRVEEAHIILHRPRVRPNLDDVPVSLLLRQRRSEFVPVGNARSSPAVDVADDGRERRHCHEDEFWESRAGGAGSEEGGKGGEDGGEMSDKVLGRLAHEARLVRALSEDQSQQADVDGKSNEEED